MSERKMTMSLDELMSDRFSKYSKYIIQDRALPDVRDGLKPVQRRILYSMYKEGNIASKPYRKSAKTVGNVIGNYHPHGDSSVYDAMVRLSQEWKMRAPLIDMQGNNGSIDNDPAAAMRYTEARLSSISEEMLRDIDKDTVDMALNFDDTEYEPTVLPSGFPNLLVNGATGISAGYATNIPPHNMNEVIEATIYRIKNPRCSKDKLLDYIKGPDFPTGGIVEGRDSIRDALTKGKGKVVVRSKASILSRKGKASIAIEEIPYEVNKAELVRKIDEIRVSKKIDGILEIRDESDRSGLRITIDLKNGADAQGILNYLYKNTDLQKSYNYNMVAIKSGKPVLMGAADIIDGYISHRKDVVRRRSKFDLRKAEERKHVLDGLIRAVSIMDDIVITIRSSRSRTSAIKSLRSNYDFSRKQAEAIVALQLYRLTNTDVSAMEKEAGTLDRTIDRLRRILEDEGELDRTIISELKRIEKNYPFPRLTRINDKESDISYDIEQMQVDENVCVSVTRDGYIKKASERSYSASSSGIPAMKAGDVLVGIHHGKMSDKLLAFTDLGNLLCIPLSRLENSKWNETCKHISYLVSIGSSERIIFSMLAGSLSESSSVLVTSRNGMIKRLSPASLDMSFRPAPVKCMSLQEGDGILDVSIADECSSVLLLSASGHAAKYDEKEIPVQGLNSKGVRAMRMSDDKIVLSSVCNGASGNSLIMVSNDARVKCIAADSIPLYRRPAKGIMTFTKGRTASTSIVSASLCNEKMEVRIYDGSGSTVSLKPDSFQRRKLQSSMVPLEGLDGSVTSVDFLCSVLQK